MSRTPPRGKRFTKGVSGNPGGRPKAIAEVVELAREQTALAIAALVEIVITPVERMGQSDSARVAAANVLLERGWGKAPQEIRTPGERSGPQIIPSVASLVSDGLALVGRELGRLTALPDLHASERKSLVELIRATAVLIEEDEKQKKAMQNLLGGATEQEIEAEARRLLALEGKK